MKTDYSLINRLPFVFVWHDGIARIAKYYHEKSNTVVCNDIDISMESITEDMIISGKSLNNPLNLTKEI